MLKLCRLVVVAATPLLPAYLGLVSLSRPLPEPVVEVQSGLDINELTAAAVMKMEEEPPLAVTALDPELPPVEEVEVETLPPTEVTFVTTAAVEASALPPLPQHEIDSNFLFMRYTMTEKVDATGDFTWKDIAAADRAGMSLQKFVVGGLDKKFIRTMATLLRGLIAAEFDPGVTSCFRSDYRQGLITRGTRSASRLSFHGGSARGGYGHGKACDVVHLAKSEKERHALNLKLWRWIEQQGKEYGIGLPYGRFDGGHAAPIDGVEYLAKYHPRRSWTNYVATESRSSKTKVAKVRKHKKKHIKLASIR